MSKTSIPTVRRRAIWEAHNKRSAYTGEPIEWDELQIDHVIPESKGDDEEFGDIKDQLDLAASFDINGLENLLPSRSGENRRKSNHQFSEANARYFLELAESKRSKAESLEKRFKEKAKQDSVLIAVVSALEEGAITSDDVRTVLESLEQPDQAFQLLSEFYVGDGGLIQRIARSEVDDMRDLSLLDDDFALPMHGDESGFSDEPEMKVKTVREYEAALDKGLHPLTSMAIRASSIFEHFATLLRLLEGSEVPEHFLLTESDSGITDLERLPVASIVPLEFGDANFFASDLDTQAEDDSLDLSGKQKAIKLGDKYFCNSVASLVTSGEIQISGVTSRSITLVIPDSQGLTLTELVRADFSGDGYEDVLIAYYAYAIGGSLGFGGTIVLTLRDRDSLLEVVEIDGSRLEGMA